MAFILLLFLLTSCTTQNDWEQYPPVQDSVPVYEDDIDIYHYYPGYRPSTPGMKVQPDYSSGVIQRKVPSMVPNERTMPTTRPATTTAPKTSPAPKTPRSAPKTSPAPQPTYSRPTPRPAPRPSYRPSSSRRRF